MRIGRPAKLAWGLFFFAPFVGEWLLGNQPAADLGSIFFLAPMYGGGALLIREVARRTGRGWMAIVPLAAAYALIEEGPIDQMIYNPKYLGLTTFDGLLEIGGTGISLSLVLASVALHTVWSICTPIAVVEAFDRSRQPWLRSRGLVLVAVVFVGGSVLLSWAQADEYHFFATAGQLLLTWAVIAALVAAAFVTPLPHRRVGAPPRPLVVGVVAFAVTTLYWIESLLTSYAISTTPWLDVVTWLVLVGVGVGLVLRWSRLEGWGTAHPLALAVGALMTYAWVGFFNSSELGIPIAEAVVGSAVFAAVAITVAGTCLRRQIASAA